jgi:hypothetical protein
VALKPTREARVLPRNAATEPRVQVLATLRFLRGH